MSYTQEEARILIDFHRKYGTPEPVNHYLEYLAFVEDNAPDIPGDIEKAGMEWDNEHYWNEEGQARADVLAMVETWISDLETLRERLKG